MTDPSQTRTSPRDLPEVAAPSDNVEDTLRASDAPAGRGEEQRLRQGETVGRYVVLSRLGAGGMGVVYAAYDPELDRKVAVKLLLAGRSGETARARLLREAQALARLAHPNVVAVHDVGVHDDQVFVAMEFVEGATLRQWIKREPRSWKQTLGVMLAAGRGLEEAHRNGLVHRDFKPDNVMVGDDGRVRVMDFGLARVSTDSNVDDDAAAAFRSGSDATATLTAAGAAPGTPAYMAAEQWRGEPADAASDQFSYCATLWECLGGTRPYVGASLAELRDAIASEQVSEPGTNIEMPGWLRQIVRRGLSRDPTARWPSVSELLRELNRGRRRARWRGAKIGGALLVAAVAGGFGINAMHNADMRAGCANAATELASTWNDDAREGLRQAYATLPGYGPDGAKRTSEVLDAWAQTWAANRELACLEFDAETKRKAEACLDIRRTNFAALVETLQEPDPRLAVRGHAMAATLESARPCASEEYLQRQTLLTNAEYAELHEVRLLVAESRRLELTHQQDDAIDKAREATERAELYALTPGALEARLALGLRLATDGQFAEAEHELTAVYELAGEVDEPTYAAAAALDLADLLGSELQRSGEARIWARVARANGARIPDPDGLREIVLKTRFAAIEISAGNYDEARRGLEELLELHRSAAGGNPLGLGSTYQNLGFLYNSIDEPEKAIAPLERAIKELTEAVGPAYPMLSTVYNNLANSRWETGDLEGAHRDSERAVEIAKAGFGEDHPETAIAKATLGMLLTETESPTDPIPILQSALATFRKSLGPSHDFVGKVIGAIGYRHESQGRFTEAREHYEPALEIALRNAEPGDPDIATMRVRLGTVLMDAGDVGAARPLLQDALEILANAEDIENRSAALLANAYLARLEGDNSRALELSEKAWALEGIRPLWRGHVAFELAKALDTTGEGARAKKIIAEALAALPPGPNSARRKLEAF